MCSARPFSCIPFVSGPAECTERLGNPPPLPQGKRWRVRSTPQVLQMSETPLKSPPSAPAHSAGSSQNHRGAVFVIFISLGNRQAKCKITVNAEPWLDYEICKIVLPAWAGSIFFDFQLFSKKFIENAARTWHLQKSVPRCTQEHFFAFHEFSNYRNQRTHRICNFQKFASCLGEEHMSAFFHLS